MQDNNDFNRDYLLEKKFICPICDYEFKSVQAKSIVFKSSGRSMDLYPKYVGINPVYYGVVLCENCGYASFSRDFKSIAPYEKEIIMKHICLHWHPIGFPKTKNLAAAVELHEIAYQNYLVLKKRYADKAKCALRLMWFFDEAGRKWDADDYSKKALSHYMDVYKFENLDLDIDNRTTVYYIIGELNRRNGEFKEAFTWFREALISNKNGRNNIIKKLAEEQINLIKKKLL